MINDSTLEARTNRLFFFRNLGLPVESPDQSGKLSSSQNAFHCLSLV